MPMMRWRLATGERIRDAGDRVRCGDCPCGGGACSLCTGTVPAAMVVDVNLTDYECELIGPNVFYNYDTANGMYVLPSTGESTPLPGETLCGWQETFPNMGSMSVASITVTMHDRASSDIFDVAITFWSPPPDTSTECGPTVRGDVSPFGFPLDCALQRVVTVHTNNGDGDAVGTVTLNA